MLAVSRSWYYAARQGHEQDETALREAIELIVLDFPGYGYRRVTKALAREGWLVNHKRVLRVMQEESLLCQLKRRWLTTTDSAHGLATFPNLLRQLTVERLNQVWVAEIVCTQMTKPDVWAIRGGRDHVPNLHIIVGHNHAVDEQFDQLPALGECRAVETLLYLSAKRLNTGRQAGEFLLAGLLGSQLVVLLRERRVFLLDIVATTLKLRQFQHTTQIRIRQPLALLSERVPRFEKVGAPRLHGLRKPRAAVRPRQCLGDALWMREHRAQVLPDERVQLIGGRKAGGTHLLTMRLRRLRLADTDIIGKVVAYRTGGAGKATVAATHQCPQQILIDRVVPAGERLILREFLAYLGELFLRDDGGHNGDVNPFGRRGRDGAGMRSSYRMRRRPADVWRTIVHAAGIDLARVGRIRQDAPQRGQPPPGLARRRADTPCMQRPRQAVQTRVEFQIEGKDLADNAGLGRIHRHAQRVAGLLRIEPVAIRRVVP